MGPSVLLEASCQITPVSTSSDQTFYTNLNLHSLTETDSLFHSISMTKFMTEQLSKQTSIFGLHLWIIVGVFAGAVFVLLLFILSLCFTKNRSKQPNHNKHQQIITQSEDTQRLSGIENQALLFPRIQIEMGKGHPNRVLYPKRVGRVQPVSVEVEPVTVGPEVSHLGWGHWYTLRELEIATDGFASENVIGQGGYGIVYFGVVNNDQVAIKNLLNNRYVISQYIAI